MRRARGMTLIEVGVALCVAGLMLAVAIPSFSAVTRAQLRQKSGQLAGGIRSLYGAAAIQAHTCRLVFDLDANSYWSECAKGSIRLDAEGERSLNGVRVASRAEELQQVSPRDSQSDEDQEKAALAQKSAFTEDKEIPRTQLGSSVRFSDVWIQHQREK
jgi:general secretion pathway protein H